MMSSSCTAGGCLDVHAPTKVCSMKLYRWAESDAEFLKLMSVKEGCGSPGTPSPHQSQLGRQKYLRSYTFSRKETTTVSERARKWLREAKERKELKLRKGSQAGGAVREVKDRLVGASCSVIGAVVQCFFHCMRSERWRYEECQLAGTCTEGKRSLSN